MLEDLHLNINGVNSLRLEGLHIDEKILMNITYVGIQGRMGQHQKYIKTIE